MEEDERVHHTLLTLKKMGVRIALDDFGTGYSSLSYLKRYAVDEIKIDRSFVRDVCSDPGDAAIVLATIQMARSLGLQTVAEGVETAEQLAFLRAHGCDRYQGYLCSRPLVADALAQLVEGGHDKLDPWIPGV
jgi:EAL domain-containing protein (putative c-di-GMP-specific phosphodiesterase class I)